VTVFGDTSALVKRYVREPGSDEVAAIDRFAVAQVTRVELPAALWRLNRMRILPPRLTAALVADFEADWFGDETGRRPLLGVVRMTSLVLEDAARLTGVHGLRGYDSIQLASARAVRRADPSITTFAAFDHALRNSAAAEGFVLVP
jgi:uncharacterized protein